MGMAKAQSSVPLRSGRQSKNGLDTYANQVNIGAAISTVGAVKRTGTETANTMAGHLMSQDSNHVESNLNSNDIDGGLFQELNKIMKETRANSDTDKVAFLRQKFQKAMTRNDNKVFDIMRPRSMSD